MFFRRLAPALANRDFRLFLLGQGVSLIGTWMQQVATLWLIYRLTGSPLLLGIAGFAGQIPTFFLAPIGGVVSDRFTRKRTLIVTQTLAMTQASALTALAYSGHIEVWHIISLSSMMGAINAFDMPTRQAFLSETLADRLQLPNAIALNSSMVNVARLIGPTLAGVLIAVAGEPFCFLLNAISYGAVLAALIAIRTPARVTNAPRRHPWHEFVEGFSYSLGFPPIRALLLNVAMVSFAAMPLSTLAPVFATQVLGGDSRTLGFLTGSSGLGALAGAIYLLSRKTVLGLGRMIVRVGLLMGVALGVFAMSTWLPLSLACMLLAGFSMITLLASSNTLLQTIVEEEQRGRLMSFYTMSFVGMSPLGSLFAGAAAQRIGAPGAVTIAAAFVLGASIWFAVRLPRIRELVRPIYVRKGIIPEVADAVGATTEAQTPPDEAT